MYCICLSIYIFFNLRKFCLCISVYTTSNKYNNNNFNLWWISLVEWLIYCWLTISHSLENFKVGLKGKYFQILKMKSCIWCRDHTIAVRGYYQLVFSCYVTLIYLPGITLTSGVR